MGATRIAPVTTIPNITAPEVSMFHQLLEAQLAELGLTAVQPPNKAVWQFLLTAVSQAYFQWDAEQDRLQAVLDNVADAIITFDEQGKIGWFNRAAEQMFGYTAVEIQGQSLELLLPERHAHQADQEALALQTDKEGGHANILSIRNEIAGRHRDGTLLPLSFTISQMMAGGERQFIGIARDITDRKAAEATLLAAKEEAEKANQAKSQFLANTSHEIRTPLNAMIGLSSLLLDTELTPEQHTYAETVRRSSNALLAILNDILDLSRIEAGQLRIEARPFHLQAVIMEVVNLLSATAAQKRLRLKPHFTPHMPAVFLGDGARLRQILMNLLSNAIKFTHHGEVHIRAGGRFLENGPYEVHLSVQDSGIGLSPDYEAWLFEPFSQGEVAAKSQLGGAGLGLAISRRLIELMHGRIWAENRAEGGATFHISFPVTPTSDPTPEAQTVARIQPFDTDLARQLPLRILVAEDNATNQKVTVWMLEHLGYRADVAANGLEVLQALKRQAYDLILMDIHMPEMDGWVTAEAIRNTLPTADQPWIVALTADMQINSREMVQARGMDDLLSKPVLAEALITALCRCPSRAGRGTLSAAVTHPPLDPPSTSHGQRHDPAQLLAIFRTESDHLMARLETAVIDTDWETARQMAHALKGSCATLAFHSLAHLFGQIEQAASQENVNVTPLLTEARREYNRILKAADGT